MWLSISPKKLLLLIVEMYNFFNLLQSYCSYNLLHAYDYDLWAW